MKLVRPSTILQLLRRQQRRRTISETNLRKKLTKYAERSEWDTVRRVLSNYDFDDIMDLSSTSRSLLSPNQGKIGGIEETYSPSPSTPPGASERRHSYGTNNNSSRNSFSSSIRNSFTGKVESAAAAAAIKAALLLDESESLSSCLVDDYDNEGAGASSLLSSERRQSGSHDGAVIEGSCREGGGGENILHDMCRCRPPVDVIETLLTSLRRQQRLYHHHHRRRRRVGARTTGQDEIGRTPLHVAAACGASPEVIDALCRADPIPASMSDADGRSPLHIAVRYLAYNAGRRHSNVDNNYPHSEEMKSLGLGDHHPSKWSKDDHPVDEEERERAILTVLMLKEVMTAHPGKVDFKDEDNTGFSPLDYAIDGNITDEHVLHCLLRRKSSFFPSSRKQTRRSTSGSMDTLVTRNHASTTTARSCRLSDASSVCSQDIDVLLRLEEEEMDTRRKRVERIRSKLQKVKVDNNLFDVFGIDQEEEEQQQQKSGVGSGVSPQGGNIPVDCLSCLLKTTPTNDQRQIAAAPAADHETLKNPQQQRSEKGEKTSSASLLPIILPTNRPRRSSRRSLTSTASSKSSKRQQQNRQQQGKSSTLRRSITSEEIYNAHLEAYMNDFMDYGLEEYRDDDDDDDSFDICHDPDEGLKGKNQEDADHHQLDGDCSSQGSSSHPPIIEINIQLDVVTNDSTAFNDDLSQYSGRFDSRSVVSEVSLPVVFGNRD